MVVACNAFDETELGLMSRQLLLNSKLFALIEMQRGSEPIHLFKSSPESVAVFNSKKNSLFFSAATEPAEALAIFIYLKANYMISLIEGTAASVDTIGAYLQTSGKKYHYTTMILMSKDIKEYTPSPVPECAFIKGEGLNELGADVLVARFSKERLNVIMDEAEARSLILSPAREFMGWKFNGQIVSIAAWIREIKGYRCFSYVYTDERYRGHGFSQLLISALLNDLCGHYQGAFLFVDESNIPALNLYYKCGFKVSGSLAQMQLN